MTLNNKDMHKPLTVYFDTNFYVWLSHEDESLATQVIRDLNALKVRHVISYIIIRELLTGCERNEFDKALVRRVRQFSLSPYCTAEGLEWEVLLLDGQGRVEMARLLHTLHDGLTNGTSWGIMARRETNADQASKLSEAAKPTLKQMGLPEDMNQDMAQTLEALKTFTELLGIKDLDWPEDPTPDSFSKLSEQILSRLNPTLVAQLQEENRMQDSVTKTEDRPYKVATGSATEKEQRRLGNTLRDTEHIMMFVNHNSEIDLLQVDRANEKMIKQSSPIHRLAELGLADRCFSAGSLLEVVEKIRVIAGENN